MTALLHLLRIGMDWGGIALMQRRLVLAIQRANQELIESFRSRR